MKHPIHISLFTKSWQLAAMLLVIGVSHSKAEDFDTVTIQAVQVEVIAPAAAPAPVEQVEKGKPASKDAKPKEISRLSLLKRPIVYPTIYPNPLAFNMAWVTITNKTFAEARSLAIRQRLAAQRAALVRRRIPDAAAQNAIQQQMRRFLGPMLKTELSFAARAMNL